MNLDLMAKRGIPLPPVEAPDGLTADQILKKINSFYLRKEQKPSEIDDFAEAYFLELLRDYPVSMCAQHLTDSQKLLIALLYIEDRFDGKPKEKGEWEGYSYEHLGVMFDRSKATIFDAIHEKESQARQILKEASMRQEAKSIALDIMVKEEKEKLKKEQNKQKNDQTTEQTP